MERSDQRTRGITQKITFISTVLIFFFSVFIADDRAFFIILRALYNSMLNMSLARFTSRFCVP